MADQEILESAITDPQEGDVGNRWHVGTKSWAEHQRNNGAWAWNNINEADALVLIARCLTPFKLRKGTQNLPGAVPAMMMWDVGTHGDFSALYGMTVSEYRNSMKSDTNATQKAILSSLTAIDFDLLSVDNITFQTTTRTPAQAAAKLAASYPDNDHRDKVMVILNRCYRDGIYAPLGHYNSRGEFKIMNMQKFMKVSDISPALKAAVFKIFKELEIGTGEHSFTLTHYFKGCLSQFVLMENRFALNKGLNDYYFFRRHEDCDGYWFFYALHWYETVTAINTKALRGSGMAMKKEADLKFDVDYQPDAVQVKNCTDNTVFPWTKVKKNQYKTIMYFHAVNRGLKTLDEAKIDFARKQIQCLAAIGAAGNFDHGSAAYRESFKVLSKIDDMREALIRARGASAVVIPRHGLADAVVLNLARAGITLTEA